MTRISALRKMIEEVDSETEYNEYWFTLDGMDNLKESRTFWDLDILSGTMILLSESFSKPSLCLRCNPTIESQRSAAILL